MTTQVPAARYESAFAGYHKLEDEKMIPWREANKLANPSARRESADSPAGATTASPASKPAPAEQPGHSGHHSR